jgi:hypothetical protein
VKLADGTIGYISDLDFMLMNSDEQHKRTVAEKAECDRRGGVSVGMTAQQVEAKCWGKPSSINSTVTGTSERQQWVYAGHNYVYLVNGVVTTVQTSR